MMTRTAAVAAAFILANSAQADTVVGSFDMLLNGGTWGIVDTLGIELGLVTNVIDPWNPANRILIASQPVLTASDVGSIWTSDPATMAQVLVNLQDSDDTDAFGVFGTAGDPGEPNLYFTGTLESDFGLVGLDREDIASLTDYMRVTMISLSFNTPGDDPNGDGNWTNFESTFRFEFVSVPTPATIAPIAASGLLVFRRRRRV